MAAPNWGDRNHPIVRALPNKATAIPVATGILTNPAAIGRLHLIGC
ncbi:hypothetical protein SAMD00079811_51610 [Scytonema sp. HK-05]|nr:hypothetical protein SAMD00079811_51610 [Scytonema sp. HK-05]